MSVRTEERAEAGTQFLMTARELMIHTVRKCKNDKVIPKRYNDVGSKLIGMAMDIYANAKAGNSIKPLNQREASMRRKYFLKALTGTEAMASWVEAMNEVLKFPMKDMEEWSRTMYQENKLLRGVLDSDIKRYEKLPR